MNEIFSKPQRCRFYYWLACGFGLGRLTRFPGTLASVAICPLLWWSSQHLSALFFALAALLMLLAGLFICAGAIQHIGNDDPPEVVWDEFAGMWVAMVFLPPNLATVLIALVVFRFLDILKPPPIAWIERALPGASGVMLDDIMAGIITNLIVRAILWIWPGISILMHL
ncbi:MAG: phosphatidylglycerophosphatase A [Gammaproteobacteria bacterium]|nr:phosphatidylglycerophosphatase A [Pseudomonadota bacterium]MCH9663710.1 phosphatidylglycerophosphatase A [Gammaproteobacteria bacterium]